MEKKSMPVWKKIAGVLLLITFVGIAAYLRGQEAGKEACEKAHTLELKASQETLNQHEKTIQDIRSESDAAAVKRFHEDNRPK